MPNTGISVVRNSEIAAIAESQGSGSPGHDQENTVRIHRKYLIGRRLCRNLGRRHRRQVTLGAGPEIFDVLGQLDIGQDVIHEDQETDIARAGQFRPASNPSTSSRGDQHSQDAPRPIRFAHRRSRPFTSTTSQAPCAKDDKIEAFNRDIIKHRPPRFVHGDVTEAMPLEIGLEGCFVVVAAVHRSSNKRKRPIKERREIQINSAGRGRFGTIGRAFRRLSSRWKIK